ncbi:MAG: type I-B CRISPR-associated protein Cas7/Cst2/DevR, partial [Conexivisphaera sp.]
GGGGENEGEGVAIARPAPVKISHAISMEPYKFDSHFNVNLGLARRAGLVNEQNVFQQEEHRSYYKYTVVVDLQNLGRHSALLGSNISKEVEELNCKKKHNDEFYVYEANPVDPKEESKRVLQLVATIMSLVRNIKGRAEDLRPKLMLAAYYPYIYRSLSDRIELEPEMSRETFIEESEEEGKRVVRIVDGRREFLAIHANLSGELLPDKFLIYSVVVPGTSRKTSNVVVSGISNDKIYAAPATVLDNIGKWVGCDDPCINEVKNVTSQASLSGRG